MIGLLGMALKTVGKNMMGGGSQPPTQMGASSMFGNTMGRPMPNAVGDPVTKRTTGIGQVAGILGEQDPLKKGEMLGELLSGGGGGLPDMSNMPQATPMQAQDFTQSPMDPAPRRLRGMYDDQGMLAAALGGYQ